MTKFNLPFPYIINHIPLNTPNNRRPNLTMKPEYITIHSTANLTSSAKNERNWLTNPDNTRTASFHIVVDEKEAIECIPLNSVAWHATDGVNGTGNRKSIGVEICESGDRVKTLRNAVLLVAELIKIFNFDISKIKQHHEWYAKGCPRILRIGNLWYKFIQDIQQEGDNVSGEIWKLEIIDKAIKEGLITENHDPDDVSPKWFILAVQLNLLEKIRKMTLS